MAETPDLPRVLVCEPDVFQDPPRRTRVVDPDSLAAFVRAVIAQHPDDLARAIREGVDARLWALATVAETLGENGAKIASVLGHFFDAATSREPAQERQDANPKGGDAPFHHNRTTYNAGEVTNPAPVPPGGADPLLPGLRAVDDKFRELTLRSDTNLTTDYADLVNWVSDEIARREGA